MHLPSSPTHCTLPPAVPHSTHTARKGATVARSTPRVDGSVLVDSDGAAGGIVVGSPAWYAWLEGATTFAFSSAQGSFTATREQGEATGGDWHVSHPRAGRLQRVVLGRSADLTLDRLQATATALAGQATGPPAPIDTPRSGGPSVAALDRPPLPPAGASVPTGALTFCFTDIAGSTQLWEQHPGAMHAALRRHDAIMRQAIEAHRGVVFKMVGDSVHAVFTHAGAALSAAVAAQRALHAEPWGATGPLRVRIALHSRSTWRSSGLTTQNACWHGCSQRLKPPGGWGERLRSSCCKRS